MLDLQTKFGQKMLTVGNWIAALVTINLVWFVITLPTLIMMILAFNLPMNQVYGITIILVWIMLAAFTLPATMATYQAVKVWQKNGSGSFLKVTWNAYLRALGYWHSNVLVSAIVCLWMTILRLTMTHVAFHVATLVLGIVLLALWNGKNYGQITDQSVLELIVEHPFKLLMSAVIMIVLFAINFEIRLIFFVLLFSMSLSTLVTYRLLSPRVKTDDNNKLAEIK